MKRKKYSEKHHCRFAFENQDFINLDEFSGHRLSYWIGMKTNSLESALQKERQRNVAYSF